MIRRMATATTTPFTEAPQFFLDREAFIRLVREANYDGAAELIVGAPADWKPPGIDANSAAGLRFLSMIADVFDYAGFYDRARKIIFDYGECACSRLSSIQSRVDMFDLALGKQECWAALMVGMSFYRIRNYKEATRYFKTSLRVLRMINEKVSCCGAMVRAFYCLGLIARQTRCNEEAREALLSAIEIGGSAIAERSGRRAPVACLQYDIARCYGLGLGWLCYNEGDFSNATAHLETSRRALAGKSARYIRAHNDIVYACVTLSRYSSKPDKVGEAIGVLQTALGLLSRGGQRGHIPYTLRAKTELALAYIKRAKAGNAEERAAALQTALDYIKQVKQSWDETDKITICRALIAESRIYRELGGNSNTRIAVERAREADEVGGSTDFTDADCALNLGEAEFALGDYARAIECFTLALSRARNSEKILAVSHLHLCRACLRSNQPAEASLHFNIWKTFAPRMRNAYILELGVSVEAEMGAATRKFEIEPEAPSLFAKEHLLNLRQWLAKTALGRCNDDHGEAAALLGIGPGALRNWLYRKSNANGEI